jgi:hypothetical protein
MNIFHKTNVVIITSYECSKVQVFVIVSVFSEDEYRYPLQVSSYFSVVS